MNENAERINGWAAMIGVVAAMGSYAQQDNSFQVFGDGIPCCSRNNDSCIWSRGNGLSKW